MNCMIICPVRDKILVESYIPPTKCPVRDGIWEKNITYLTARQFAKEFIFYRSHIPNGIKSAYFSHYKRKIETQHDNYSCF